MHICIYRNSESFMINFNVHQKLQQLLIKIQKVYSYGTKKLILIRNNNIDGSFGGIYCYAKDQRTQ